MTETTERRWVLGPKDHQRDPQVRNSVHFVRHQYEKAWEHALHGHIHEAGSALDVLMTAIEAETSELPELTRMAIKSEVLGEMASCWLYTLTQACPANPMDQGQHLVHRTLRGLEEVDQGGRPLPAEANWVCNIIEVYYRHDEKRLAALCEEWMAEGEQGFTARLLGLLGTCALTVHAVIVREQRGLPPV